jgi:hypothetical protein
VDRKYGGYIASGATPGYSLIGKVVLIGCVCPCCCTYISNLNVTLRATLHMTELAVHRKQGSSSKRGNFLPADWHSGPTPSIHQKTCQRMTWPLRAVRPLARRRVCRPPPSSWARLYHSAGPDVRPNLVFAAELQFGQPVHETHPHLLKPTESM